MSRPSGDTSHPDGPLSDASPTVVVGGMWRRLLAALIDTLFVLPVLLLAAWLAHAVAGPFGSLPRVWRPESVLELILEGNGLLLGAVGLALAVASVYGLLFVVTTGTTPGLRLMRLKIINVFGESPESWRVVLRCFGFLASCLSLGLGFLWMGFDREKRGLADLLAGTYVVRRSAG